jgi:hypothetical protein
MRPPTILTDWSSRKPSGMPEGFVCLRRGAHPDACAGERRVFHGLPHRVAGLAVNATVRVWPRWAFGLAERDFAGLPTRSVFESE